MSRIRIIQRNKNIQEEVAVLDGKRIQQFLIYNGYNLNEFQAVSGISKGDMSRIISGRKKSCRIDLVYRISKYLKVSIDSLIKTEKKW